MGNEYRIPQNKFCWKNATEKIKPGSLRLFALHLAGVLSVKDLAQQLTNQELAQLLIAIALELVAH